MYYNLADYPSSRELEGLGATLGSGKDRALINGEYVIIMAEFAGIVTTPATGDWFISGAIPEAYRHNSKEPLSMPYMIAKLIAVKVDTVYRKVAG